MVLRPYLTDWIGCKAFSWPVLVHTYLSDHCVCPPAREWILPQYDEALRHFTIFLCLLRLLALFWFVWILRGFSASFNTATWEYSCWTGSGTIRPNTFWVTLQNYQNSGATVKSSFEIEMMHFKAQHRQYIACHSRTKYGRVQMHRHYPKTLS